MDFEDVQSSKRYRETEYKDGLNRKEKSEIHYPGGNAVIFYCAQ